MEKVTRTVTKEEVVGYRAIDGEYFGTEEECKKYEESAKVVAFKKIKQLMVGGDEFSESSIFENFGYGSEEYHMAVLDIKTEKDLNDVNVYYDIVSGHAVQLLDNSYIGKRVLVNMGSSYDRYVSPCPRTLEELLKAFEKDMRLFFYTKEEREEQ